MLAIIMSLGSDIKAVSLVSSVRTHHLDGNVEEPVKWFKQIYLAVLISQGEIGEIINIEWSGGCIHDDFRSLLSGPFVSQPQADQGKLVPFRVLSVVLNNHASPLNSHPLWQKSNCLPQIIASPPPSTPLAHFSFFYPLPVKLKIDTLDDKQLLKWSLMQQNWSVMILDLTSKLLALKISQGTHFGTLIKPMFSMLDVIIFLFNGIVKQNTCI